MGLCSMTFLPMRYCQMQLKSVLKISLFVLSFSFLSVIDPESSTFFQAPPTCLLLHCHPLPQGLCTCYPRHSEHSSLALSRGPSLLSPGLCSSHLLSEAFPDCSASIVNPRPRLPRPITLFYIPRPCSSPSNTLHHFVSLSPLDCQPHKHRDRSDAQEIVWEMEQRRDRSSLNALITVVTR